MWTIFTSGEERGASLGLTSSLLDAKLSVPQPRPGAVSRPADRGGPGERLPGGRRHRAGGLRQVDPAGAVGAGRGPPGRVGVARPLRRRPGGAARRCWRPPTRGSSRATPTWSPTWAARRLGAGPRRARWPPRSRASPDPFVLMLDDLHELRSPACHDVLGVVIAGIPAGSQLVAASRSEQPTCPRCGPRATRWSSAPATWPSTRPGRADLRRRPTSSLTPELAAAVDRADRGLAGRHLPRGADREATSDGEALTISGDDRYVADYLYRESLMQLPEDQRFLRRTAVLDQLSRAAVRRRARRARRAGAAARASRHRTCSWSRSTGGGSGTATTGCSGSSCSASCAGSSPRSITKLHLRAADWYEANGSPALALEHLLNTPSGTAASSW